MNLPGIEPRREIGDELDRCYTPDRLADAVVQALRFPGGELIIEPSAGGGAFVRALRRRWLHAVLVGVDLDPAAPGRVGCNDWIEGSWPEVARSIDWQPNLIVGNPPFGDALEHVTAALSFGCNVAFILPLAYLGVQAWGPLLDTRPPAVVRPIRGRPWSDKVRETAVFEWWADHRETTSLVPLVGWPR